MDRALVINLSTQPDRFRDTAQAVRLALPGLTVERVPAVQGEAAGGPVTPWCSSFCTPSMVGCFLSHRRCWAMAQAADGPTLVLEDDARFPAGGTTLGTLTAAMAELPPDWDLLFLGCFTCAGRHLMDLPVAMAHGRRLRDVSYSQHLSIPSMVLGTHAYVVSPGGAQRLLALLDSASNHVDIAMTGVLPQLKAFACRPQLAVQAAAEFANSSTAAKAPTLLNRLLDQSLDDQNRTMAWMLSVPVMRLGPCVLNGWVFVGALAAAVFPVKYSLWYVCLDAAVLPTNQHIALFTALAVGYAARTLVYGP